MTQILLRSPKSPFEAVSPDRMLSDRLMGGNSGNLIFLESAYKLLDTRDTEITVDGFAPEALGADAINERFDAYLIPLANAFRPTFEKDLIRYTAVIKDLKIPVVVLGAGLQSSLPYNPGVRPFDDTVTAFVRAVLDRSGSIGVRGEFSAHYLRSLGFNDVEVIGCPSMFLHGDRFTVTKRTPALERDARIGINITPRVEAMGPIITSHVERYPNLRYIGQEKDVLKMLLRGENPATASETSPIPIHLSHPLFRDDKTRFFVGPWPWMDYLRGTDFVFGTRIHGNIVSLVAGTPSYVFAHDTRTLELARYFEIPHRVMTDVPATIDAAELYAEADYRPLMDGHAARFRTFIDYVEGHGLHHVFEPGEDPDAFDRRMDTIDFPGPVRRRRNPRLHRAVRRAGRLVRRVGSFAGVGLRRT